MILIMNQCDLTAYPVSEVFDDVRKALLKNFRAVLSAPTGSGKSTVLPLALLNEPWLENRKIIILEPRRIAAYAVANQLARNLNCELGSVVGYRMRLDSCVSAATRIEVVTEGMLTRKLQQDPFLTDTALIIFDEFHERSLQSDLALALTLDSAESLREDLRILVMSATLESEKVSALLGNAPVISSQGRSYPVEIKYFPRRSDLSLCENCFLLVKSALTEESGSILVFLPGEADIKMVAGRLESSVNSPDINIIPLYGRLDNDLQRRAIEPPPPGKRKVVLATAIAESSLTIDGVRIVIDSGLTKIARYQIQNNLERLETVNISQDAAAQRAGRAGRTEPGIAWRMWSEYEESKREKARPSQISYSDLTGLILELAAWGITDIKNVRFMESLPEAALNAAYENLRKINAVDSSNKVTAHGRFIHNCALSVRSGHLIATAVKLKAPAMGIKLAALLDTVDTRRNDDPDITSLVKNIRNDKRLSAAWRLAQKTAKRLKVNLDIPDNEDISVGALLAAAFPESVARRRGNMGELRYLLASGKAAIWREMTDLARYEFIVALSMDDKTDNALLQLAAGVEEYEISELLADRFTDEISLKINPVDLSIDIAEERKLGAIVWSRRRAENPDRKQLCKELSNVVNKQNLQCLDFPDKVKRLRAQLSFIHKYDPECGLPLLSDQYIGEHLEELLYNFLPEKISKNMLKNVDWYMAVSSLLDYNMQRQLSRMLPEKITLENNREFKIDYTTDPPSVAGKLQWFFGVRRQPALFNGKLPLNIVLLSPANRPVQITCDIGNFWSGSYKLVRNDLRGRYPKHDWPENP